MFVDDVGDEAGEFLFLAFLQNELIGYVDFFFFLLDLGWEERGKDLHLAEQGLMRGRGEKKQSIDVVPEDPFPGIPVAMVAPMENGAVQGERQRDVHVFIAFQRKGLESLLRRFHAEHPRKANRHFGSGGGVPNEGTRQQARFEIQTPLEGGKRDFGQIELLAVNGQRELKEVRGIDGEMGPFDDPFVGGGGLLQGIFHDAVVVGSDQRGKGDPFLEETADAAIFVAQRENGFADLAAVLVKADFGYRRGLHLEVSSFDFTHRRLLLASFVDPGAHDLALENQEDDDLRDDGEDQQHEEFLGFEEVPGRSDVVDADHEGFVLLVLEN